MATVETVGIGPWHIAVQSEYLLYNVQARTNRASHRVVKVFI